MQLPWMSGKTARKLPWLPTEIVAEIIEHVAIRPRKLFDSHHTYYVRELRSLCLVSKSFYSIAAPLLYREVIIFTNFDLSSLAPSIYPFLSPERRCELRALANEEEVENGERVKDEEGEDEKVKFLRMNSRVDPQWVKTLTLLEPLPAYFRRLGLGIPDKYDLIWQFIEEIVKGMTNIEKICWEPQHQSTSLSDTFSKLNNLSHLACGNTGGLCDQNREPVNLRPLRTLSIYWKGPRFEGPDPGSLRKILHSSAGTLKTLQLSTHNAPASEIPSIVKGIFTGWAPLGGVWNEGEPPNQPIKLKSVEELLLDIRCTKEVTTTIIEAIDFSHLSYLQLGRCEEAGNLLCALQGQKLRFLRKISLRVAPYPLVKFLDSVVGLEEIYVVYEKDSSGGSICDTDDVLGAVMKHGKTLRSLMLNMEEWQGLSVVKANGFSQLVKLCPNLEQLWINPDFNEWSAIVKEICKMRVLQHIYVSENHLDHRPIFSIKGDQKLRITVGRAGAENLDSFDKAMGLLLEESVAAAASRYRNQGSNNTHRFAWRSFSALMSVTISGLAPLRGSAPDSPNVRETNSYILKEVDHRPPHSLRDHPERHYMPKIGDCYVYEAHGVCIALQNVNSRLRFDKQMDWVTVPLCGWHTAFKAPSYCMVKMSENMPWG